MRATLAGVVLGALLWSTPLPALPGGNEWGWWAEMSATILWLQEHPDALRDCC
jgi:hypothetical protein